jgi:TonB family protein
MDVPGPVLRNATVPNPVSLRQSLPTPEIRDPAVLVDVLVLSADLLLFDAIRGAIGERNPVWRARSAEESVDLLLTGRCGVLLVDMAVVSTAPTTLITQIVDQFPDVVVVVAGRLEDEALLARSISDGCVYRFMHKPLTAKRAGMFLHAAIRRHVELRESRSSQPLLPPLTKVLPGRFDTRKWLFVATGLAIFIALLWLFAGGGQDRLSKAPTPVAAPVAAPLAFPSQPLADPVLSRARAAFAAGRLEAPSGRNALDLYAAVLLSRPDQAEARAGLDRTIDQLVSLARLAEADGNHVEARRLLVRVRSADASNPAVTRLAEFLAAAPQRSPTHAPTTTSAAIPQARPVERAQLSPPPVRRAGADPRTTATAATPVTSGYAAARLSPSHPTGQPATTSRRAAARPDPLTPTVVNADEIRADALRVSRGPRPARSTAIPTAGRLPIAGYVSARGPMQPAPERPLSREDPTVTGILAMPSDELDRVYATDPVYPTVALRDQIEGWVELGFTITETGAVREIEVLDSAPRGVFESAASEALGSWRFKPRLANGLPVAHRSTVTLRFDIDR